MPNGISIERCPSGIPGFDKLCNGGFVRGSVNAVLGGPGSGKSTMLLQFLFFGAVDYKENGLYIHFEVDAEDLYKDALSYGWDFAKLDAKDVCKFMHVSPEVDIRDLKTELTKLVSKYDVQRICFDPVNLFKGSEDKISRIRQGIYELMSLLKRMHVTILLSTETASTDTEETGLAGSDVGQQYIKFLSDGLIDLHSSGLGGISDRAIRIVKMRRTSHERGPIPMEITNKGMQIIYTPERKRGG